MTNVKIKRWLAAAASAVIMAVVWLVILPWLGQQKSIRQHVEALHAADINASAMFYSELECDHLLRR